MSRGVARWGGAVSVVRASSSHCRIPRLASYDMSTTAVRPTRENSRWEAQRSFDELGRPLRDLTFCVVDLETTGGSAAAGSMITEIGAVKVRGRRGARRVPDAGQPAHRDPRVHRRPDGHQQLDGPRRTGDRVGTARLPRVRGGMRPGRPQRTLRRRLPPALRSRAGSALAALRGARHRQAGAPRDHARRRPQLQALVTGEGLQLRDDAQPPRPVRRAGDRRRPARTDGAPGWPGRPHAGGAPDLLRPGQHGPAPQAPPRRGPPPRPRGLPVPRRPFARPLHRHLPRSPHSRAHLLHGVRDPHPDGRDGRSRHVGDGDRVRDTARGRGARAAVDRGAQAEVQPPLPLPGEGALRQADA